MAKCFALHLAYENLKRSRRLVFPYFIAAALMSAMYFVISNVIDARAIANLSYGGTTMIILEFGRWLMTFFIALYMLYLNSFLISPRKREFGLYGVLGLEKRHIARVVLWEGLLLNGAALAMGLLSGCAFGQLCFRLLLRVMHVAQGSVFRVSSVAVRLTLVVFGAIFLVASVYNLLCVYRASVVSLLSDAGKTEKKPRFVPLMAVLGLLLLAAAYAFAVRIQDKALAIAGFWPAVLLVIIATYLLFTSGSAFALSLLSRAQSLYYRPSAFITIGFMKRRMKQNAAGLANICILSTMVLVTCVGCCALYFGQEDILRQDYPESLRAYSEYRADDTRSSIPTQALEKSIYALAADYGVAHPTVYTYEAIRLPELEVRNDALSMPAAESVSGVYRVLPQVIPLDSYAALTGDSRTLAPDEVLLLHAPSLSPLPDTVAGYAVADALPLPTALQNAYAVVNTLYIVAPSRESGREMALALYKEADFACYVSYLLADLPTTQEQGFALSQALRDVFFAAVDDMIAGQRGHAAYYTGDIYHSRQENYAAFGGLLFLGAFCAILFAVNTVLIIYFKQLSEGMEDRARYAILQKVGMDESMVRRTIRLQVLILFFLPLAAALMHTAFAFPLLCLMVSAFKLYNTALTLRCALVAALAFSLCYAIVFKLTARTYFDLVRR